MKPDNKYLIIGKQEHDVQEASKLQLLLACLLVTLPLPAFTGCCLPCLHTNVAAFETSS